LDFIAQHFDVVEINSSFYQPLKPEVVRLWMRKVEVNPQFLFTAKLHQRFTHARVLEDQEIAAFKEGLWALLRGRKLGAVLIVKATGCHDPASAKLSATAIGEVNGQRRTVPLEVKNLAEPGAFAL